MGAGYDILVSKGGLDALGAILSDMKIGSSVTVVADSNVTPLYGEKLMLSLEKVGLQAKVLSIPAGEKYKTLETVEYLWNRFLEIGMDRKSAVVALGGGVTGDLSGFSASTYMRGIPWVIAPTTLLAMVDSSLGGKTGCDLPQGKNLVGTFYPPRLVVSDPNTLITLPEEEFRSGMGEVVKHGIIADPQLFEMCSHGYEEIHKNLLEIVRRAVAVKIKLIESDPYERGMRAKLNLGHTIGHALEKASDYRLRHGEAISIGMVAEARLSELMGLAHTGLSETIAVSLMEIGLPTKIPHDLRPEEILNAMRFDKKKESGRIRFALPIKIGEVRVGVEINDLDSIFLEI